MVRAQTQDNGEPTVLPAMASVVVDSEFSQDGVAVPVVGVVAGALGMWRF